MTTTLENHPIYLFLKKEREWNDIYKFVNIFPTIQLDPLSNKDTLSLMGHINSYLFSVIDSDLSHPHFMLKTFINGEQLDYKFQTAFSIYQKMYLLDSQQKSMLWKPYYIARLDQFIPMQEFFDQNFPNVIKQNAYRTASMQFLQEDILEKVDSSTNLNVIEKNITRIENRFDRYQIEPKWGQLLAKNSSLLNALLARDYDYEFNSKELYNLFYKIKDGVTGFYRDGDDDKATPLANAYASVFMEVNSLKIQLHQLRMCRSLYLNF